jgi:hypothetical protein
MENDMAHKLGAIVRAISEPDMRKLVADHDHNKLFREMGRRFPGITVGDLVKALQAGMFEHELEARRLEATAAHDRRCLHLLSSVPGARTLGEAVTIKAAEGDAFALQLQQRWNSTEHRVASALSEAGMRASGQWRENPETHAWTWLGDGPMPSDSAIIDQFEKTHPADAKRIRAEIEALKH